MGNQVSHRVLREYYTSRTAEDDEEDDANNTSSSLVRSASVRTLDRSKRRRRMFLGVGRPRNLLAVDKGNLDRKYLIWRIFLNTNLVSVGHISRSKTLFFIIKL